MVRVMWKGAYLVEVGKDYHITRRMLEDGLKDEQDGFSLI
jgi:hypothetical protein